MSQIVDTSTALKLVGDRIRQVGIRESARRANLPTATVSTRAAKPQTLLLSELEALKTVTNVVPCFQVGPAKGWLSLHKPQRRGAVVSKTPDSKPGSSRRRRQAS